MDYAKEALRLHAQWNGKLETVPKMKIENRTELKEYRIECQKKQSADCRVLVCGGTGCLASGSGKIYEKLKELTKDHTGV